MAGASCLSLHHSALPKKKKKKKQQQKNNGKWKEMTGWAFWSCVKQTQAPWDSVFDLMQVRHPVDSKIILQLFDSSVAAGLFRPVRHSLLLQFYCSRLCLHLFLCNHFKTLSREKLQQTTVCSGVVPTGWWPVENVTSTSQLQNSSVACTCLAMEPPGSFLCSSVSNPDTLEFYSRADADKRDFS